ncbi:MAG: MoxR family ATPase [Lapillicoccus sp.]
MPAALTTSTITSTGPSSPPDPLEDVMHPESSSPESPFERSSETAPSLGRGTHPLEQALYEVKKTIVGQDDLVERMIVALLARGHLLVEGVPGLAKTMAIKTLAQAVGGEFQRIQFTPDLVPADLVGTRIYNQKEGEFQVSLGPIFANLVLADEINRAPAKVQSALLEVMQERQVTIGRQTYPAPDPFLVMATQNPIESEGTYALPEAQVDRFMLKVLIGYPSAAEEFVVVERMIGALAATQQVLTPATLKVFQRQADAVYVDPAVIEYAVQLATATRDPARVGQGDLARYLTYGASPRASINMVLAARALAFLRGRDYALATDVRDLARDVLRHRIVLSYEALAEDLSADDLLTPLLEAVAVPAIPLRERPPGAPGTMGSPTSSPTNSDGSPWTRPPR